MSWYVKQRVDVKMQFRWFRRRYIILAGLLVLLSLPVLLLVSRRPVGDYSDPGGPSYEGSYAIVPAESDDRLRLVSWNLHYGEKLDRAIAALESVEELRDADILLLQEINSDGVEMLAQYLQYNYIFYPAAFHRQRRQEYGNAILSKWPLSNPKKVVLPNWLPGWLQSRNAARAMTSIGNRDIAVYSVHLDTTWMIPQWVISQGDFLVNEVDKGRIPVILGGDFNTWTPGSIEALENGLGRVGLERLTRGTGYTFEVSGLKLTLDHIFSVEGLIYQAGVYRQTDASDHYPLWAELSIEVAK
jgi:endonuclease/exonuclease/phosphatase family metal-dependent hydrolase